MVVTTDEGFALASNLEEVALRRKLLFRLLRDFDFAKPKIRGEMITDPIAWDRTRDPRHPPGR